MYCSYATPGGHALVGARIYLPADQFDDDDRRAASGISDELQFRTKPQLATDILADMIAEHTRSNPHDLQVNTIQQIVDRHRLRHGRQACTCCGQVESEPFEH